MTHTVVTNYYFFYFVHRILTAFNKLCDRVVVNIAKGYINTMYRWNIYFQRYQTSVIIELPTSYGSWIYNHLCNQYLSSLTLWVRIPFKRDVLYTTLCDRVCQWLAEGRWFSPGTLISSTNKTDRHDITEILLKVALNTISHNHHIYFKWHLHAFLIVSLFFVTPDQHFYGFTTV